MECTCCNNKEKHRDEKEKDVIISHLNRISGQINGIKQMIEDSRYCDDVLMQVSAAKSSLNSLGLMLIDNHLHTCVKDNLLNGQEEVLDELMKTIERFNR